MNQSSPEFFDCLIQFQDLHLRQNVAELTLDATEKPLSCGEDCPEIPE